MLTYICKWKILHALSAVALDLGANIRGSFGIAKHPGFLKTIPDEDVRKGLQQTLKDPAVPLDYFLDVYTESKALRFETQRKKEMRRERYLKILEECNESEPQLAVIYEPHRDKGKYVPIEHYDYQRHIRLTGKGYVFARWDTLVHALFFKEYRGWILLILAIAGSNYITEVRTHLFAILGIR